jgi:hypothetical protein
MSSPDPTTAATIPTTWVARLESRRPLAYTTRNPDLPPHVRAGSALRAWRGGFVVVQDDVQALAMLASPTDTPAPMRLPPGPDGRMAFLASDGSKAAKLDLEAAVTLPDGRLVVFGSGSTAARMRLVVASPCNDDAPRIIDASTFYTYLCSRKDFSGSELNLEGVVAIGPHLRLFQRGNGAARDGLAPVNTIGDLALDAFLAWLDHDGPVPELIATRRIDLGAIDGAPLTFTDAVALDGQRVAFLACAEASPDTYRDGPVHGMHLGLLDADGTATTTPILEPDGAPTTLKLEGLEYLGRNPDGSLQFIAAADPDDPDVPAVLASLRWGPP